MIRFVCCVVCWLCMIGLFDVVSCCVSLMLFWFDVVLLVLFAFWLFYVVHVLTHCFDVVLVLLWCILSCLYVVFCLYVFVCFAWFCLFGVVRYGLFRFDVIFCVSSLSFFLWNSVVSGFHDLLCYVCCVLYMLLYDGVVCLFVCVPCFFVMCGFVLMLPCFFGCCCCFYLSCWCIQMSLFVLLLLCSMRSCGGCRFLFCICLVCFYLILYVWIVLHVMCCYVVVVFCVRLFCDVIMC